jgi:hypothetical protein
MSALRHDAKRAASKRESCAGLRLVQAVGGSRVGGRDPRTRRTVLAGLLGAWHLLGVGGGTLEPATLQLVAHEASRFEHA